MSHNVDVFIEGGNPALVTFGWECFTPGCRQEASGFEDIDSAEAAADEHNRNASA